MSGIHGGDLTHGEKIIKMLLALWEKSARKPLSLRELSEELGCSKQTAKRLVEKLRSGHLLGEDLVERREKNKFVYSLRARKLSAVPESMSEAEQRMLWLSWAIARTVVGDGLADHAARALGRAPLTGSRDTPLSLAFSSLRIGTIDYSGKEEIIRTLLEGIVNRRVCMVRYHGMERTTTFHIKPLKLFFYKDALYVHARQAKSPWHKGFRPVYDPILAVHRFEWVRISKSRKQPFDPPDKYDFDKAFNKEFGLIKGKNTFTVRAEFYDWAATFVEERTWVGEKTKQRQHDKVFLELESQSEPEILTWILSFGACAKVLEPDWLVKRVKETIQEINRVYG